MGQPRVAGRRIVRSFRRSCRQRRDVIDSSRDVTSERTGARCEFVAQRSRDEPEDRSH